MTLSNPFPNGVVQPSGNSLGLLTGTGGDIYFVDPNRGAPRVQQYSADFQRELPGGISLSLGYTGLTGIESELGGIECRIDRRLHQHQPARSEVPEPAGRLHDRPACRTRSSASPAPASSPARPTIARGQLLRPFPQFGNVYMEMSTGAHSQYNAGIVQLRKRVSGLWGGTFSYTYSRLNDNQWGETNYYSSNPGIQNNYEVIPGSAYYNPDLEYGRSLLDSPHKVVIAPTLMLPFGEGQKYCHQRRRRRDPRRLVDHAGGHAAERLPDRRHAAGVDRQHVPVRRHAAAEHRSGPGLPGRRATSPIGSPRTPRDNLYFNKSAFTTRAGQHVRQRAAHAPRRLLAVAQQRRPVGQQERAAPAARRRRPSAWRC